MSVMDVDCDGRIEDLVRRVSDPRWRDTTVDEPLRVLLHAVAGLYLSVLAAGREPRAADRDRIRGAARVAAAAGITDGVLVPAIRRLTGAVAGPPSRVRALSHLVLAECLAAVSPPPTRLEPLLGEDASERPTAETYTVVVFRPDAAHRTAALLAELDGRPVAGHELLAGRFRGHAVLLVPGTGGEQHARRLLADVELRLGRPLHAAFACYGRDVLPAGYREAAKVLGLALAAEREPGLYGVDDFLVEYAALRDPAVAAKLVAVVRPLLGSDRLYETLKTFVRCGHNRGRTARELCVHRTTVDYRIRRIEEITGHDPTCGRGRELLSVATVLFALAAA